MTEIKKNIKAVLRKISSLIPRSIKERLPAGLRKFLRSKYEQRTILIDIVGYCNLKCPSCPNSNSNALNKNPIGMMGLETFKKILERVSQQWPGTMIGIYNWTEPFLHPQIVDFIRTIHSYGLKSCLSSNLNLLPSDLRGFAATNSSGIRISVSGFTQKIYEIGHRGGNIETVKENMRKLSSALKKAGASTKVTVYYHKYLYNLDEIDLMRNFAESLGFDFGADWAYFMPIEGVQDYLDAKLSESEVEFIENRLALDIKQAVEATKPFRKEFCFFPITALIIDWRGQVQLCCAVYDSSRFSLGSYLDMPWNIIEEKLKNHPFCQECTKNGLHIYVSWHGHRKIRPVYEAIAQEKIKKAMI